MSEQRTSECEMVVSENGVTTWRSVLGVNHTVTDEELHLLRQQPVSLEGGGLVWPRYERDGSGAVLMTFSLPDSGSQGLVGPLATMVCVAALLILLAVAALG